MKIALEPKNGVIDFNPTMEPQWKEPAGGSELFQYQIELRQAIRGGRTWRAYIRRPVVYVGFEPKKPCHGEFPVGMAFLELFEEGKRGAVEMSVEACARCGFLYSHAPKAVDRVKRDLKALQKLEIYERAKIKSGRKS